MNIKQFVVKLSDDEHRMLKRIAVDNDVSIQQIIRETIEKYLQEYNENNTDHVIRLTVPKNKEAPEMNAAEMKAAMNEVAEKMRELGEVIAKAYKK